MEEKQQEVPEKGIDETQKALDALDTNEPTNESEKAAEAAEAVEKAKQVALDKKKEEEAKAMVEEALIKKEKAQKIKDSKKKLTKNSKRVKGALYAKVIPSGHFRPLTAEVKNELVEEAAKHLLWANKWDVDVVETTEGRVYIIEEK